MVAGNGQPRQAQRLDRTQEVLCLGEFVPFRALGEVAADDDERRLQFGEIGKDRGDRSGVVATEMDVGQVSECRQAFTPG